MKFARIIWNPQAFKATTPDMSVLEGAVFTSRLPGYLWNRNMLFFGTPDLWLKKKTGVFPGTIRSDKGTHPVFILSRKNNMSVKACPCSSKGRRGKYVSRGCRLEMTGRTVDKDTYILTEYTFNLPLNPENRPTLEFWGRVPAHCIREVL